MKTETSHSLSKFITQLAVIIVKALYENNVLLFSLHHDKKELWAQLHRMNDNAPSYAPTKIERLEKIYGSSTFPVNTEKLFFYMYVVGPNSLLLMSFAHAKKWLLKTSFGGLFMEDFAKTLSLYMNESGFNSSDFVNAFYNLLKKYKILYYFGHSSGTLDQREKQAELIVQMEEIQKELLKQVFANIETFHDSFVKEKETIEVDFQHTKKDIFAGGVVAV